MTRIPRLVQALAPVTATRIQQKAIAFLYPYFKDKYGASLVGISNSAVDPQGDKLYIN
jgi:hypothetical protein